MTKQQRPENKFPGPVDNAPGVDHLIARVVTTGTQPRIHGYSVEDDLALHYGFSDLAFLSLSGELPSAPARRAFEVALSFYAPSPINEAPAHASVLARLCRTNPAAIISMAAVTVAEQARYFVEQHSSLLTWLNEPDGNLPTDARAQNSEDRSAVARLRKALGTHTGGPVLEPEHDPSRDAALLGVLFHSGLQNPDALVGALLWSRLLPTIAEAFATRPLAFKEYPMNLPEWIYEEGDHE